MRTIGILLAAATLSFAQTSRYNQTVSAQPVAPGSVNYVEGQVSSAGQPLSGESVGHFALQPGQPIETANGHVEVLLTPGAYLRVGSNSALNLPSAGLSNTRVDLTHGTAMIEVDQMIEGTHLDVTMGSNTIELAKKGLYSFDANQQLVRVLDGKLQVTNGTKTRSIGKGDQILLSDVNLKKSDFNLNQAKHDELYVWSEVRSRDEADQNLMAARDYGSYPPVNGWFWNPYGMYYGFWPTSAYLYSPFGFGFYGYPGFYGGIYHGYFRPYRVYRGGYVGIHAVGGIHGHRR